MNLFEPYLSQWGLEVDGEPVITATSRLLPVRHHGLPAMLKISTHEEAQAGGRVLAWWNGDGAARVLAIDGDALLGSLESGALTTPISSPIRTSAIRRCR